MPFCAGLLKCFAAFKDIEARIYESIDQVYTLKNKPKFEIIAGYSLLDLWHKLYFATDSRDDKKRLEYFAQETLKVKTKITKKTKKKSKTQTEVEKVEVRTNPFVTIKSNLNAGYGNLSAYALRKILPFLQQGYLYHDAVTLARFPDLLPNWETQKVDVLEAMVESQQDYEQVKAIHEAVNALIGKYKYEQVRAGEDEIEQTCQKIYQNLAAKSCSEAEFKELVMKGYADFMDNTKRNFRQTPPLRQFLLNALETRGLKINAEDSKKLYHHSNLDNIYGTYEEREDKSSSRVKKYLPKAQTPSIKNPMFNKAMAVLRRLLNYLIHKDYIDPLDSQTEVVLEIARGEVNDNNERLAIEKYQRDREKKRKEICEGLEEDGIKITNRNIRKYELWQEQQHQCLYTGKMIGVYDLFFANQFDIEHTVPRSLLPDDTMANQTVADAYYNRDVKDNRLPSECPNYDEEVEHPVLLKLPKIKASSILAEWEKERDEYKKKYEDNKKAKGSEDEQQKNTRVMFKHYYKMHYDYWRDKLARFEWTREEVLSKWASRQLKDTQTITKYARQFLQTVFSTEEGDKRKTRVHVQTGESTALFRKIYGFETEEEEKDRSSYLHHIIDAVVLALIPPPSRRKQMQEAYYKYFEEQRNQKHRQLYPIQKPDLYPDFDVEACKQFLQENTLAFHLSEDKIIKQTKKVVRKQGKIQYDPAGQKLYKSGATIRGDLFDKTFLAKNLRDQRHKWKSDKAEDKTNPVFFAKHIKISELTLKKADDIVDEKLRRYIKEQLQAEEPIIRDFKGRPLKHVRIKWVKKGQKIKERHNHPSKYDYKNAYYAESGEIPYALLLEREHSEDQVECKLLLVRIHQIAQTYKVKKCFDQTYFIKQFYKDINIEDYSHIQLLKKDQKVIVLKGESERNRRDKYFLNQRLYRIIQFTTSHQIKVQYHLESRPFNAIEEQRKRDGKTVQPANLQEDGQPIILLNHEKANLFYEGIDFTMSIDGAIKWLSHADTRQFYPEAQSRSSQSKFPKSKSHVKKNSSHQSRGLFDH